MGRSGREGWCSSRVRRVHRWGWPAGYRPLSGRRSYSRCARASDPTSRWSRPTVRCKSDGRAHKGSGGSRACSSHPEEVRHPRWETVLPGRQSSPTVPRHPRRPSASAASQRPAAHGLGTLRCPAGCSPRAAPVPSSLSPVGSGLRFPSAGQCRCVAVVWLAWRTGSTCRLRFDGLS